MPHYTVKQGDCISSIASTHGLPWESIWNHPNNARLKEKRQDPDVLYPGDVLFIPEKGEKMETGATEKRHRFRKKGVPAKLRLCLLDHDEPRGDEPYILDIDGDLFSGTTRSDGTLECSIPPNAKKGRLIVGEGEDEYLLDLGHIDPIDEISGVQARLNNLGFHCGVMDGVFGPETEAALRQFQREYNLTESGKVDDATQNKLLEIHGS